MIKIMKKNYLLLAVTAIMMSVGAYSLVDTKEASVLMSLKEVEALADQESDGGEGRYSPYYISVDCCMKWEFDYTDSQGASHYRCVSWIQKTSVVCVAGNESCTAYSPC